MKWLDVKAGGNVPGHETGTVGAGMVVPIVSELLPGEWLWPQLFGGILELYDGVVIVEELEYGGGGNCSRNHKTWGCRRVL